MAIDPAKNIELSRLAFDDVDHMVEWSHSVGWDNFGTQLTPGANPISYDTFVFPGLSVSHLCVQQSIHNAFALPKGMVVFLICREKLPLAWCGRHLSASLLGIARSGSEHDVVLHAGWDAYEFMVSEDLIRRTEIFPPEFFDKTTQLERAFLPLMEPITGQFLQRMDAFFRHGRDVNGTPHAGVRKAEFYDFIIRGLHEVIDAGLSDSDSLRPRPGRRPDLVTRGREFVSAYLTDIDTTDDLAQALGVSYRVLNYAFTDFLGISPYQYILGQRLHAVRRQLKSGVPVLEACAEYGFSTPNRFSRQYRRLFGELPSQTRNRNGL